MPAPNLDKLSYKQLLELEVKIQDAIAVRKQEEKAAIKRQMAELAANAGFDIDELIGGKRGSRKGSSIPPKYRHSKDPTLTWSGRGRQPLWLVAEIKKGKKLNSFLIK